MFGVLNKKATNARIYLAEIRAFVALSFMFFAPGLISTLGRSQQIDPGQLDYFPL